MIELNQYAFFSDREMENFYKTMEKAAIDFETSVTIERQLRKFTCSHKNWIELYGIWVYDDKLKFEFGYVPRYALGIGVDNNNKHILHLEIDKNNDWTYEIEEII
jgi:hypothetical protein